ncbi:MAG TPA: NAD(P)-dependent oxidoreductase [Anaerohalosphaeraceae bacterium]|jgi:3-hydroxyisobutyrate dehydrogenase|nr:NAD(P)-dependent oxidoreductase [Anaerohalosphaeraceae bacterium]HRT49870.1 NAD(P)-dependent oxidoreductase [Anaerohalosphaeraceae bacterium]HRT86762.1 NAD(P)-dependent oxidoreductase [Anaerohalosphaeraceae bacterium]
MTQQNIAFIGTGIMGAPMALNLLKAGHSLIVHSRTSSKAQPVIDAGAAWADTPADAARDAEVVITCVTDTPNVEAVLLGPNGVIESARPDTICIDMSTISPDATRQMGRRLAEKRIMLLDAPVSGGQIGATEARLSIMVGGPADALERVRPILMAMGKTITHCGPLGAGQTTKLANQIMVVHTIMSVAEGLAFAERAGLDLQTTLDATVAGAAGSNSLKVLGPRILAGDMKPTFMVDLQLKDLRLVLEYAKQIRQPLPGVALINELFSVLHAQGRGKDGTQALVDVIRRLGPGPHAAPQ